MKQLAVVSLVVMAAAVALAGVANKDGTTVPDVAPSVNAPQGPSRADFEYNSGGALNVVPTTGGSATGWAEYFVVLVANSTASHVRLDQVAFPCAGPSSTWGVWLGSTQPANYSSPDFSGAFTPTDTNPATFPPTVYSYVDVTASNIVIPPGTSFWLGYLNPGTAGQVDFNGTISYGWYGGAWDPDNGYGRTTVLQVIGTFVIPVELQSFSAE